MRKRIIRTLAAFIVGCASIGGLVVTAAAPAAHAASCGDIGITYQPTLTYSTVQLPDGPASMVRGQVLFVVDCAPLNGEITLELQKKFRTGLTTYWAVQGDEVSRNLAPPLPRGFALNVGPWLCVGRSTWRMFMTWKGTAADGTYQTGDAYLPSSSGSIFTCIS